MRRRLAAPVLMSAVLVSSFSGVATGADPDVIDTPPKSGRAEQPSTGDELPKVGSDRTPQTAPGANGYLAYASSPFNELPNAIWSMAENGADQNALVPNGGDWGDVWPAYSPGGTMIAFTRDTVTGTELIEGDIYVVQANGTGPKRLTSTYNNVRPVWTPDGSRLVFTSYRTGGGDIYSMSIDGTNVRRLTTNAAIDSYPSVSPDGTRIAFGSDRDGDLDVYTMNIDGSGVTQLTNVSGNDYHPDWSPDGSKIAFTSLRTGDAEVFVMNADGSGQTNLTNDGREDLEPTWSPDAMAIAYWSYAALDSDIYVMLSTGGPGTAIGATLADEWGPDWQPIPAFPLVDARFSPFESYIEWVFDAGITSGCSSERYCPNDSVTRGQMASFLARALHLSGPAPDAFTDDETSVHEVNINLVAREGIASGCGVNLFCPAGLVKRDQMASFLSRALDLSGPAPNAFTDDNGNLHEVNINLVAREGIATGCGVNLYCPSANVTRGQMAAFLYRAFAP
jgi:Tol biopolymer transport system component